MRYAEKGMQKPNPEGIQKKICRKMRYAKKTRKMRYEEKYM